MNKNLRFIFTILICILVIFFTRCRENNPNIFYYNDEKYGLVKVERLSSTDSILSLHYSGDTNRPKDVVSMRNGKRNGLTKEYYENGILKRELYFVDDKVHGLDKQYDSINGSLKSIDSYKDNKSYNTVYYSEEGKIVKVLTLNYYPKPNDWQIVSRLAFDEFGNINHGQSYYVLISSIDTVQLSNEYICNVKLPFKNTTKEEIRLQLKCFDKWNRIVDEQEITGKNFEVAYKYKSVKRGNYKIRGFVLYPTTLPTKEIFSAQIYLEKDFYVK